MSISSPDSDRAESREARLALAREALAANRASCFWYLSPDFEVTEETLSIVINGLRRYGDRAAFQLAARLCR